MYITTGTTDASARHRKGRTEKLCTFNDREVTRGQKKRDYLFSEHFGYLWATDALALVAFVTVGLASHGKGLSATGYARDALPLLGGWFAAAGAFKLYRRPSLAALLSTWLAGVTAGVLVRSLVLLRLDRDDAVFLPVALCFTLLFVVGIRILLASVRASWPSTTRSEASR